MKKFLSVVVVTIIALLLLELLVRWSGYAERYIYDPIYMPFPATADIAYVHQPNLEQVLARSGTVINTDSLGLRSVEVGTVYAAKAADEIRIAIVGDSFTFGQGVADTAATYPELLELQLRQQLMRPVQVFNFSVSGYSVRDMAATLPYRMTSVEPDLVIMAITPQDFYLARTGIVDSAGYAVKGTVGSVVESRWWRNRLRRVHLLYALRDAYLALRFTIAGGDEVAPTAELQPVATAASTGETAAATAVTVPPTLAAAPPPPATIPPALETALSENALPDSYEYILHFQSTAEALGIPYLIVLLPILTETAWPNLALQMEADGLHVVDLSYLRHEFTVETFAAGPFDGHPSAAVHQRIGEELLNFIELGP